MNSIFNGLEIFSEGDSKYDTDGQVLIMTTPLSVNVMAPAAGRKNKALAECFLINTQFALDKEGTPEEKDVRWLLPGEGCKVRRMWMMLELEPETLEPAKEE